MEVNKHMDDDMKKGLMCCGLIIVIAVIAFAIFGGQSDKPVENKTVEIDGIKFDAPVTNNNTTSYTKLDDGSIAWSYEDYQNNVSVYISDTRLPGYNTSESYNELDGYNQIRPIGDKWFVVCADRASDKNMVFNSAHMD